MSVRSIPTTFEGIEQGPKQLSRRYRAMRLVRRRPIEAAGAAMILVVVGAAITANIVAPYGFAEQDFASRLLAPSSAHFFGTDSLGRDVFSRIIYGARTSMMASTSGVIISGLL